MLKKICLILLMHLAFGDAFVADKNCDSSKCPSMPKHYEELDCVPVKTQGDCCASSYKCPDLTARDGSKCYYNNEVLNSGEYLKSTKLGGICSASCYCQKGQGTRRAELQCAHIDCPEYFGGPEYSDKCVRQYDKGHCCSIKTVCDDEVKKLSTCVFEGETYREGQRIYPSEHCYECYCKKDFNNQTSVVENPNCNKIDCGINLRNTARIIEGCIPVYYKKDNCCPIGWRCPGEKHLIENISSRTAADTGPQCKFGKMKFSIGESLDLGDDKCQKCSCKTPPMLHCIETC